MKRVLYPLILAALLTLPAAAQDATAEATSDAPTLPLDITFTSPVRNLMPEGVVWDAEGERFLVGSLLTGTIYSLTPAADGTAELIPFIDDELAATVGLEIDAANQRLLVTDSAADAFLGGPGAANLAAYDLATGERIYRVDLAALTDSRRNFANDVTVDADGNAYVTNSFAPLLYKVTPEGEASVLVEDEALASGFLGGNGLVAHPDGFLLVANSGNQSLIKVTLDDDVTVMPVELDVPFGADGLILAEDGTLYGVAEVEGEKSLVAVTSEDDWESATVRVVTPIADAATTVTLVGDTPYYVNSYLNNFTRTEYEIVGVEP